MILLMWLYSLNNKYNIPVLYYYSQNSNTSTISMGNGISMKSELYLADDIFYNQSQSRYLLPLGVSIFN